MSELGGLKQDLLSLTAPREGPGEQSAAHPVNRHGTSSHAGHHGHARRMQDEDLENVVVHLSRHSELLSEQADKSDRAVADAPSSGGRPRG